MRPTRLVLLPGMDGTGILFEPLLNCLHSGELLTEVVCYPVNEPRGYKELLAIVQTALPRDGPFVILGESFSGPLAIMAAAARPPGLQGIVLCASFAQSPAGWFARLADVFVTPVTLAMAPTFIKSRLLLGAHATPPLRSLLSRAEAMVSRKVMAARIKAVLRVDVTDELTRCPVPVLYLRAQHDRLVPSRCPELIAKCNSACRVVNLSGPHLLLQSNPAEAVEVIREFIGIRAP